MIVWGVILFVFLVYWILACLPPSAKPKKTDSLNLTEQNKEDTRKEKIDFRAEATRMKYNFRASSFWYLRIKKTHSKLAKDVWKRLSWENDEAQMYNDALRMSSGSALANLVRSDWR